MRSMGLGWSGGGGGEVVDSEFCTCILINGFKTLRPLIVGTNSNELLMLAYSSTLSSPSTAHHVLISGR
jgi:hypothetical protein